MLGQLLVMICCSFASRQMVSGAHAENQKLPNYGKLSEKDLPAEELRKATCNTKQSRPKTDGKLEGINALQKQRQKQRMLGASLKDAEEDASAVPGPVTAIALAFHPDKCLHVKGLYDGEKWETNFVDGTNIELGNCYWHGYPLVEFIMPSSDDSLIRFSYDPTKCLAVAGGWDKPLDGANLQLWSCNSSEKQPNMQFTVPWRGTTTKYAVHSAGRGAIKWSVNMNKCIDTAGGGTSLGTNILMRNCHDGPEAPNQQFILAGATSIRWAAHPDKCLHVEGVYDGNLAAKQGPGRVRDYGPWKDGTNVQLGNCDVDGYPLREFIMPISYHSPLIHFSGDVTKCLAVAGGWRKPSDGANLQIWSCNSSEKNPNMQFTLPAGKGEIKWSEHPNKCIDIAGGGTSLGTNILMWSCHHKPNQQFFFGPAPTPAPTPAPALTP